MKKLTSILILFAMVLTLSLTALALPPKIVDQADLLTDSEESALAEKAQRLTDTYDMDVVIVTVWSLGGKSSEAYADDYFDYNGYGVGPEYSGVLLLLAMEDQEWAISTCGETIYALTDYALQSIFEEIAGYLSNDDYYRAFDRYLDELEPYFEAYSGGSPVDGYVPDYDGPGSYEPGTRDEVVYYPVEEPGLTASCVLGRIGVALLIGAIAAGIVICVMRGSMKTAKKQTGAAGYMTADSLRFLSRQDFFLYSRTSRTAKPQDNGGGGRGDGRSGGSSVHRGSSGRSHGGARGRF